MSQKKKIQSVLANGNEISSLQAFHRFNITRLGAIIYTLKQEGDDIQSRWAGIGQHRYKVYYLR